MTKGRPTRKSQDEVILALEGLTDEVFLKFFRMFLNIEQYPYNNQSILNERYNSILVLLADVPFDILRSTLEQLGYCLTKKKPEDEGPTAQSDLGQELP